jgi:uncharacterized repeat protein (TIGR03803 family)
MTTTNPHPVSISRMNLRAVRIALIVAILFGVVNQEALAGTFKVLYRFKGTVDGGTPSGSLIQDANGNLYGTTYFGGTGTCNDFNGSGCGTVFKLDITGKFTVLHSFTAGADGAHPAGLIIDAKGNLYGTTEGGASAVPTVFKVDQTGKETTLCSFSHRYDGSPAGGLIRDAKGNFYGTTAGGGIHYAGSVFELTNTLKLMRLYSFTGRADGAMPDPGLARDAEGNLYGDTFRGGHGHKIGGVVFKVDKFGKETVLYTFTLHADGGSPLGGVIRDAAGNLYGTTYTGGTGTCPGRNGGGCGTVFRVDKTGKETVLYAFSGSRKHGTNPWVGVIADKEGNFYGTTSLGGDLNCQAPYGCGVVFKLDKTGKETVLHAFTGLKDGQAPYTSVIRDSGGDIYGTTSQGGGSGCGGQGCGVVFKITP